MTKCVLRHENQSYSDNTQFCFGKPTGPESGFSFTQREYRRHNIMVRVACTLLLSVVSSVLCASAQESPIAPDSTHRPQARAVIAVAQANTYTKQVEERIWRAPAHVQPVAWARLFALWYESGYRSELRRLRDDPAWQKVDPDKELDCSNIPDPWLRNALSGIARRSESMQARRQRIISAAYVLEILAPLGKGVTSCVLIEMQSKAQDKHSIKDWPSVQGDERDLFRSIAAKLGRVAEDYARKNSTFDRAVELAHTIVKLRSAEPLGGFINAARDKATKNFDSHAREAERKVLEEAVDSMEVDPDPIFAAELGNLLFSPTAEPDLQFMTYQTRYAAVMPSVLDYAAQSPGDGEGVCDLAGVAGRLQPYLPKLSTSALNLIQLCAQAALAAEDRQIGPPPATVDGYVSAAQYSGNPAKRATYKLAAARVALKQQQPSLAVELAMSVTPEERQKFQGSWRRESLTIVVEAARMLHASGDSPGLDRLWDVLPNTMRAPAQIAVAMDALDNATSRSPEFAEFMLRLAYRTLEDFGTDDSEAIISFANGFARVQPADARLAFRDAMKWLNRVPHPTDPWRDRDRYQRERFALEATRDVPAPLGREFKPAPFHVAIVLTPNLDPEVPISNIDDVSDQVSLYLGLTHAALTLAKRSDAPNVNGR
jgi:hypothetical protein